MNKYLVASIFLMVLFCLADASEVSRQVNTVFRIPVEELFPEGVDGEAIISRDVNRLLDAAITAIEVAEAAWIDPELADALNDLRPKLNIDKFGAAVFVTEIRLALLIKVSRQLSMGRVDQNAVRLLGVYAVSFDDVQLLVSHDGITLDTDRKDAVLEHAFEALSELSSKDGAIARTMLQRPNFLDASREEILAKKEGMTLLLRWIVYERYRQLEVPLILKFIERGGRVEDLSMANVATLYDVVPKNEVRESGYKPLGIKSPSVGSILSFFKLPGDHSILSAIRQQSVDMQN